MYSDFIIICSSVGNWFVYDKPSMEKIGEITPPVTIHANTAVFDTHLHEGNDDFPYLYVSEWNGLRRIFVFDLSINEDGISLNIAQTISFSVDENILGKGMLDFAIDFENKYLYSVAYKIDSDKISTNNAYMLCKFTLPETNVGEVIMSNVIEHWEQQVLLARQASLFFNDKIYTLSGSPGVVGSGCYLSVTDVYKKKNVSIMDLSNILKTAEPEGIVIYDGSILLFSYSKTVYRLEFQ